MAIRCAIVDDEKPARDRVRRMLQRHDDVETVGEAATVDEAVALIDGRTPDVCFLDVQMPGGDGFEVLARARHRPHVVFTTAYDEYAVRAFEVHSVDYLLKPFSRERFDEALERARSACASPADTAELTRNLAGVRDAIAAAAAVSAAPQRIVSRRGSKIVLLDPAEILCFEAEDTLIFARLADRRLLVERTLAELEQQLAPGYFRAHRRYLVNLSRIREIVPGDAGTYRIVLQTDPSVEIPLSRRQARRLKEIVPW